MSKVLSKLRAPSPIHPLLFLVTADGEVYGDGDDDSDVAQRTPEGMPLLMFVLIALTGGALCILNITGALCFLRRRTFFQGIRGKA